MIDNIPHSEELERAIIGAMFYNNEVIPKISSILTPMCFHIPNNQIIYRTSISIFENKTAVSEWTVFENLKKQGVTNIDLNTLSRFEQEAPPESTIESCCNELIEKYKLRFLIARCDSIARGAESHSADPDQLLFQLNAELKDYNPKTATITPVKKVILDCVTEFEKRQKSKNKIFGLRTGMYKFDNVTGGLQDDDFILIGGRPSMGKTAFMLKIATGCAKHNKDVEITIFSLESKKEKLGTRMIGQKAKVDTRKISSGTVDKEDEESLTNIFDAAGELSCYNINFIDEPNMQLEKLISTAIYLNSQRKQHLICIDYAQLIGVDSKKDPVKALDDISKSLKGLARTIQCPVVALAQLNRSLENRSNKRPIMSDLKGTGSWEQDADVIMFIYRDVVYNQDTEDPEKAEIIIGKSRDSGIGKFNQKFIQEYTLFEDY
jgi:replicative DNA helicase